MPDPGSLSRVKWIGLAVLLPILFAAAQIDLPRIWGTFRGDSAVYYAMAQSLAWDHDLRYTKTDLERVTREWSAGPEGILLVASDQNPDDIRYAKPFLYSLAGAPLVRLLQSNGLLILNVLCFGIILRIGFFAFSPESTRSSNGVLWTLVFWGLSAVPAYLFTLTPEIFNAALIMIGLLPWMIETRRPLEIQNSYRLLLSAAILGIATVNRPPSGLFLLIPLGELIRRLFLSWKGRTSHRLKSQFAAFFLYGAVAAVGIASVFLITYLFTGQFFSHGGFRKRIVGHFPYETALHTFLNTGSMISTRNTRFIFHWDILRDNLMFFFLGRHSGLIPYFLPAAVSMLLGLRASRPGNLSEGASYGIRWSVWFVTIGQILFHLIYIPSNYHGGSCSIGNRYLISYLPCFFLLPDAPPRRRTILAVAAVTALLSGAIALSPIDSMSAYQQVSKRSVLDRFPLETTLLNAWPIDDPSHTRIQFKAFHAYFADDNQWGPEGDGFWVKGGRRMSCVLRFWNQPASVEISIRNGASTNRIRGEFGDEPIDVQMQPGETVRMTFSAIHPAPFYNLEGNPSYCYTFWLKPQSGFVPRFTEASSTDGRYLGCFIEIGVPETPEEAKNPHRLD